MVERTDIAGVPEDTRYLGDRLDKIAGLLEHLIGNTNKQPEPALVALPLQASTRRFRALYLVFAVSATATITLRVGTASKAVYNTASADTRIVPLFLTIDNGIAVTLETSAGTINGYLIGFPE